MCAIRWAEDDIAMIAASGAHAVAVPKVEGGAAVARVRELLARHHAPPILLAQYGLIIYQFAPLPHGGGGGQGRGWRWNFFFLASDCGRNAPKARPRVPCYPKNPGVAAQGPKQGISFISEKWRQPQK